MPPYLAPGVYVEQVPSAIKPISGVGTSTAAFIGVSEEISGPWDQDKKQGMPRKTNGDPYTQVDPLVPTPLNSWTEFTQKFGDIQRANHYLALALFGFFNNGGTRCWVTRIEQADPGTMTTVLAKHESIDEIAIVAVPLPPSVTQPLLHQVHVSVTGHCNKMKDRFAILDSTHQIANDNLVITDDDKGIWRPPVDKLGYSSFYFPWIYVADPVASLPGAEIAVPPSGHLAGIYARSDAQRGVQKAPANEIIMGALGVKYPISRFLQDSLNPGAVNCIRSFSGTIKVYGARTLAAPAGGDPEWKYISTRRVINFLSKSIEQGTQWVVFEPNAPDLWSKIRRNVGAFLNAQWAAGMLVGATPQQAYFVVCDETNNPPEVQRQGQVVADIGVAVVQPAEFVIFRLSQWAGPAQ